MSANTALWDRLSEPFRAARRAAFRGFVRGGVVGPVSWLCARAVREVNEIGHGGAKPRFTLLALNPDRFRGDLPILAETGIFRVLKMPFEWQARFYQRFQHPVAETSADAGHPGPDLDREAYRAYLRRFLPEFYRRLGVDAVIGAAVHYRQDRDIGAVSEEIGVPYIVLHRENLVTNAAHYRYFAEIGERQGRFTGSP